MGSPGVWTLRVALGLSLLDPILAVDLEVQRRVQAARPTPLEGVLRAATEVGRPVVVLGALLGVAVFTGPAGPATARHTLLALVPTNAAVEVTKRAVNRTRPDGESKRSNASFPSSHAANAFAVALAFSRRWRRLSAWFFLFAVVVAISRVYLNRHFVSDVLVGAAVGLASAWVAGKLLGERGKPKGAARP